MSQRVGNYSGYTVEYQNKDNIWKQLHIDELVNDGNGIALAHYTEETWLNAMVGVMSYEAAVAVIAVAKANSSRQAHYVKHRIRRWDVTYELKATETDDTVDFVDNLFEKKSKP